MRQLFYTYFLKGRSTCRQFVSHYPALLLLVSLLLGIILSLGKAFFPNLPIHTIACLALLAIIPVLSRQSLVKFVLVGVTGYVLSVFALQIPTNNYGNVITPNRCGVIAEIRVTDRRCVARDIEWLGNPRLLYAEMRRFKYSPQDNWHTTQGAIAIRLPKDAIHVEYGDILEVSGVLEKPQPLPLVNAFDFGRFLKIRGINGEIFADTCQLVEQPSFSVTGVLLDVRNFALRQLTRNMTDTNNRRVFAALTLGCRQGLDYESKQAFIRSGTVHIFTVSGLHVGMVAFILIWTLRFVPFRARYFLMPLLLATYVGTIGFQPSAVRALLMIALWSCHRAFLRRPEPLNIVFLSAVIILLINPLYAADMGFQFSFTTVAFLIISTRSVNHWLRLATESFFWVPPAHRGIKVWFWFKVVRVAVAALVGCLVAWLASSGVAQVHQGIYAPLAVAANLAAIPFVWLIFALMPFQFASSHIPWLGKVFPWLVELIITILQTICDWFATYGHSGFLGKPSLLGMLLFYTALLGIIVARRKEVFLAAAALLIGVLTIWHWNQGLDPNEVLVLHGGRSQRPCVIIRQPVNDQIIVINAPSKETGRCIATILNAKGINQIDWLLIQSGKKEYLAGVQYLNCVTEIDHLVLPKGYRRSRYGAKAVSAVLQSGTQATIVPVNNNNQSWHYQTGILAIAAEGNVCRITYGMRGQETTVRLANDAMGKSFVEVTINGKPSGQLQLVNTNKLGIYRIRLDGHENENLPRNYTHDRGRSPGKYVTDNRGTRGERP